jgi:hypothetical protein
MRQDDQEMMILLILIVAGLDAHQKGLLKPYIDKLKTLVGGIGGGGAVGGGGISSEGSCPSGASCKFDGSDRWSAMDIPMIHIKLLGVGLCQTPRMHSL